MTETRNALKEFDICLSLSEISLNTQFSEAWRIWRKAGSLDEVYKVNVYDDGEFDSGLTANFEAPKISLSDNGDKLSQLGITLKIKEGTVVYNGGSKTFDISRASIHFFVDLERKLTSLSDIKAFDEKTAKSISELVEGGPKSNRLSYDDLSIESLFLDFMDPNLIGAGTKIVKSGGAAFAGKQSSVLIACLREMFKSGNEQGCILGTLVHVKPAARRLPSLAPSQFVFKVSPHKPDPRASSLDYLGVFQGRSLDSGQEARAAIRTPWIDPTKIIEQGMTAGVMVIKGEDFSKLIVDALETTFGSGRREKTNVGWKLSAEDKTVDKKNYGVLEYDSHRESGWSWTLNVVPKPGESCYELSMTLEVTEYIGLSHKLSSNFRGEWSRKGQASAKLFLDESNTKLGFSVKPRLEPAAPSFQLEDVKFREIESSWTRAVDKLFDKLFKGSSPEDDAEEEAVKRAGILADNLKSTFSNLVVRLTNFDFIPPGDQEFNFTTPRFTFHSDLIMDVKYKKPVIVNG